MGDQAAACARITGQGHMSSSLLTTLWMLAALSQPQTSPELISVVQRATEYVTQYEAELGNLIGSEEYIQNAVWLAPTTRGTTTVAKRMQRRVSSDFLMIQVGPEWAALRKVNRVDGSKVKEIPSLMNGRYESEFNTVDCQAFYSNFRPFEVDVKFEIHPPVQ
jgi:hypothetical protein